MGKRRGKVKVKFKGHKEVLLHHREKRRWLFGIFAQCELQQYQKEGWVIV